MVEGRSLSSLTALADNPPQHLRKPTDEAVDPLILYIAKVPGKRDIFLTTIKPRSKTVTAEDINSCLYYFHVDDSRAVDDDVRKGEMEMERENTRDSAEHHVHRKPVPPVACCSAQAAQMSTAASDADRGLPTPVRRRPVPSQIIPQRLDELRDSVSIFHNPLIWHGSDSSVSRTSSANEALKAAQLAMSPRGPLGPRRRPTDQQSPAMRQRQEGQSQGLVGFQSLRAPLTRSQQPGADPCERPANISHQVHVDRSDPYANCGRSTFAASVEVRQPSPPLDRVYSFQEQFQHDRRSMAAATSQSSLVIIQEGDIDIQIIRRNPYDNMQWTIGTIHKTPRHLTVDIDTPGYQSFVSTPSEEELREKDLAGLSIFRREVLLYPKPHRRSRPWDFTFNGKTPSQAASTTPLSSRKSSYTSLASGSSTSFLSPSECNTFTSPWATQCKLVTADAGRSLMCQHHLASSTPSSNTPTDKPTDKIEAVVVSELRSNLPRSVIRAGSSFITASSSRRPTLAWKRLSRGRKSSEEEIDDILGDALALGQEPAGGGNRGKRSKLGKLIIEPEGLAMLDLLVGINVGHWWSH